MIFFCFVFRFVDQHHHGANISAGKEGKVTDLSEFQQVSGGNKLYGDHPAHQHVHDLLRLFHFLQNEEVFYGGAAKK